jgi:Ca2+-binding RTX toxin-like protein
MAIFTGTNASETIRPDEVSPSVDADGATAPSSAADTISGGGGADTIDGGGGDDVVSGDGGDDRLLWHVGGGSDVFDGGGDFDTLEVTTDLAPDEIVVTANGARVRLDGISPIVFSLDIGTTESLIVNLGGGSDTFSTEGSLSGLIAITVDAGAGNDTILGSDGGDVIRGGANDDFVDGNRGSDTIALGGGNDIYQWDAGDGDDEIDGGSGTDTFRFNGSATGEDLALSIDDGRVLFTRDIGNVTQSLDSVEILDLNAAGGADHITINDLTGAGVTRINVNLGFPIGTSTGDGAADTVVVNAGTGNNFVSISTGVAAMIVVSGAEGADTFLVNGMSGRDTIDAGGFNHALTIDGGTGRDTVSYAGATSAVTIDLRDLANNEGAAAGHTYTSIESLTGSRYDDLLMGNGASNFFDGGKGSDYLFGGRGNDIYVVDNPGDIIIETAGQGNADEVRARVSYTISAPARVEILKTIDHNGTAGIRLTGNAYDQSITGNAGRNTLSGKGGVDIVDGGKGMDQLAGGIGRDTFVFSTRLDPSNIDTITDFARADDTIRLHSSVFTALTTTGTLAKSAFHASTSGLAADTGDRIIYETDTGKLFYDRDGTGLAAAVQFAVLKGQPALNHADFVIV